MCYLRLLFLSCCLLAACVRPAEANRRVEGGASRLTTVSERDTGTKNSEELVAVLKDPGATVTNQNWFSRMGDSFKEFVIGIILLLVSLPVLWVNEQRSARMESLIARGKEQARSVEGKFADKDNDNWLVHLADETACSTAPVTDKRFNVILNEDCLMLRSNIEVYQIMEEKTKRERETLGGGKEITTVVNYEVEWSGTWHDSSGYVDQTKRRNTKPVGLDLGPMTEICDRVDLGAGYVLTDDLVMQCRNWKPALPRLPQAVTLIAGNLTFTQQPDGRYYHSASGNIASGAAQVGDIRVTFEYVPNEQVSVIALQIEKQGEHKGTFRPYRLIWPGLCGMREADEKIALRREGNKTAKEYMSQAGCPGPLACLCCIWSLVMKCFAAFPPEIYHVFEGSASKEECFRRIEESNDLARWGMRCIGWLLMLVGSYALFAPLLTFIKVVPWLGPLLANLGGWLIWFLCFLTTLLLSTLVVSVAHLVYHPIKGLMYLAIAGSIVVLSIVVLSSIRGPTQV